MEERFSLLSEEGFAREMEQHVLPFLQERETELFWERIPGRKLHLLRFDCDHPRGVILVSHGFTESGEKFLEFAWYLLQEGYTVFLIDHAGHGRSYRLNEDPCLVHIDRWQSYTEDLLFAAGTIRKACPGLPLYLYGHSMGGGIAAAAAATDPGAFLKLILSSPMIEPVMGMPMAAARVLAAAMKLLGKSKAPVPGYHPFDGSETFAQSMALSPARFEWYLNRQKADPSLQTCGASFGWAGEAARLSAFLLAKAPARIQIPVLLLQAGRDTAVSNEAQDRFIAALSQGTKTVFPDAKHELYRCGNDILLPYYRAIFGFLAGQP